MTNYYDIWLKLPETPAFTGNISAMIDKIIADGGTSPTVKSVSDGNSHSQSIGTKPNAGNILLHFRLPQRLTETELLAYLEEPMVAPLPPLTVMIIQSAKKTEYIDDGNTIGHYEYETLVQANKATFLPFMSDVPDGNGGMEPPTASSDLFLSSYAGAENIELV